MIFPGVWVIASLPKSPGFFLVFLPLSTTLYFDQSQLVLLFSKSFNPCSKSLVTVPRVPITIGITITFMFKVFFFVFVFLVFEQVLGIHLTYFFLLLSVCIINSQRIFYLIFLEWFLIEHMPLVRMVKFKLLAQFLLDQHPYTVVSAFILFLRWYSTFAYYVTDPHFLSITI